MTMSEGKNVLFVHQSSELYGSDKVLLYIVELMLKRGLYYPLVIIPDAGPLMDELKRRGVEVHVANVGKISRSIASPLGLFKLVLSAVKGSMEIRAILNGRKMAVVHSNTLAVFSGAVFSWLFRVKHVWHVHEIIMRPRLASKLFPRLANFFSDVVLSNSTLTERWLVDECQSIRGKSVVAFNGLPDVSRESRTHAKKNGNAVSRFDGVTVSLVGRINRWKGQELFIDAVGLMKERGGLGSVRFLIVGDPAPGLDSMLSGLKDRVSERGLTDYFCFVPFAEDVWAIWDATDIAVVPSTEPEPFGMVAIEAMAVGVPVIAAAHGGLLDIVVDGVTGLLFSPRNPDALCSALEKLINDQGLRRAFGEEGMRRQKELFSIDSQVSVLETTYQRISK